MAEFTAFLVLLTSIYVFVVAFRDRNGNDEKPMSKRPANGIAKPSTRDSSALRAALMKGFEQKSDVL